jgi:hypothetical protein
MWTPAEVDLNRNYQLAAAKPNAIIHDVPRKIDEILTILSMFLGHVSQMTEIQLLTISVGLAA